MTITELCWMSQRKISQVSKAMILRNIKVAQGWFDNSCFQETSLRELDMARLGFLLDQLDRRRKQRLRDIRARRWLSVAISSGTLVEPH